MARLAAGLLAGAAACVVGAGSASAHYTFALLGDQPFSVFGQTRATGINNSGVVAGYSEMLGGSTSGFVYANGTFSNPFTSLPDNFANDISISGISNNGDLVGAYLTGESTPHGPVYRLVPYLYTAAAFTVLPPGPNALEPDNLGFAPQAVNDSLQVAGFYLDANWEDHGLRSSPTGYDVIDYPGSYTPGGASGDAVSGLNDQGVMTGFYVSQDQNGNNYHGFVDNGGTFTDLFVPGSRNTIASGVNNLGVVAGYYLDNTSFWGTHHGFLYANGVYQLIDDSSLPGGVQDAYFTGINDLGQVSGYYADDNFDIHSFVASPGAAVPEPAAWALITVGIGLAGLGLRAGRRARHDGTTTSPNSSRHAEASS
jgi:probable HAF family extracellular repeat protein